MVPALGCHLSVRSFFCILYLMAFFRQLIFKNYLLIDFVESSLLSAGFLQLQRAGASL